MRIFVAVQIDRSLRERLSGLRPEIERTGARGSWVRTLSMHLTLKFLGEIEEDRIPAILGAMTRTTAEHPAFPASIRGLGVFPDLVSPRVLWAGLQPLERLVALQRDLEKELQQSGFPAEKRGYHPHLTLLRIKSRPQRERLAKLILTYRDFEFGQFQVHEAILYQSLLKPGGAEYNVLGRVPLPTSQS